MKPSLLALLVLASTLGLHADVLLDDTWANATRTNQNLPISSAWWFSYGAATAQTNSMFVPMRSDNTALLGLTWFTSGTTNAVRLIVGESLTVSLRIVL